MREDPCVRPYAACMRAVGQRNRGHDSTHGAALLRPDEHAAPGRKIPISRGPFIGGLVLGPVLLLAGFVELVGIRSHLSDATMWGLLAFPTVVLLLAAAVAALLRRNAARWLSIAIGAAVGSVVASAVVVGGITGLAYMLSDPVPRHMKIQADCPPGSGPDEAAIQAAITSIPKLREDLPWYPATSGHTNDCRLFWTLLTARELGQPKQLLFFNGPAFVETATPTPRPGIDVADWDGDTVTVQYMWFVGGEPPCCPSGQTLVRFRLTPDGRVVALDALPPK